ncbi:unnamed protein product [Symbiodinium natans]|uniref:Reverse transcriptase domain-containing protein n=1 Tax=Symbiodinium natans TaxID=878477 RepID=A0A812KUY2_9DINO|nr:unnamed protein product [Symbiodinium natans]
MAGGRYHVCKKCGPASWIFAAKVPKFPKCQWCGTKWPTDVPTPKIWSKPEPKPRPRKPKTNKVHDCLRKVWDTLPEEACVQLKEAGFEAKPARAVDVDLVALLQQHVGDLPQVIVDALPATPTPDPRQEGKEAGDVLRSSVGKLRDLGQRKLRLQEEIDTAKDNLRAMLHKMQDIQNAIEEAKVEVAKTTKEYEDKVVKHCAEEVNNGVESVLQALGMQEASLTEEQKRKLEALKSDEAKRRCMQVCRCQAGEDPCHTLFQDPSPVPISLAALCQYEVVHHPLVTGPRRWISTHRYPVVLSQQKNPTTSQQVRRIFLPTLMKLSLGISRILVTFHASQGCGYVIVALRSKGVDFNWISLYLESGTGLDSPVNDLILTSLTQHLSLLQGMWVVGGDFNVPIQDFLNSRYEERWQGRVVGSGSPTAGGDSEIDFFVVHPSLQSLSTVRLSFDTPFKPHGLLTLDVPVHSLQLRVPTIRSVVSPAPSSFHARSPVQLVQILNVVSQQESSLALGQWSRDLQSEAQATTGAWTGGPMAIWDRWRTWLQTGMFPKSSEAFASIPPDDPLLPVLKDWVHADDRSSLTRELVPQVETKYKEALASQTSQNSESYSKWLEEAQNDHLRPLYRSLRADEQTLERPYREFTPLARPYKRLEFWCEVWQGNLVSPAPLQGEVWDALFDLAREQVRSLPKHSASSVAKICAARNPKKGGPDGWDFNDLRDLPRDAYAVLANVFKKMEEDLAIPLQVSQVQIVLLAKSALKERPIGLTSVLWRLWCKTRRFLVSQWLDSYIPDHPFDSAIPGRTSLDVALARKCSKESARVKGLRTVSLFVDINGFYDSVSWQRLCEQGLRLSFPALALCLSLRLYQGGRTVVGESQPSPTIFPGLHHCDVWLDDVSADSLHASPDIAAGAAYEAFRVLKVFMAMKHKGSRYGSTDTILDMTAHEVQDPYLIVVTQHVESLFRMMARCNRMGWEAVKDTWRVVWKRLEAAKHGWSVVTGPISAMCQYLRDLQVDGHDPSRWVFEERVLEIKPSEVSVVCQTSSFLTDIIKTQRSRRMGSASSAAGAGGGVDWTVPRRLLKSVRTKTTRYAYRAVFQGSILHNGNGGKDVCKFCGDSGATLRHLMYECPSFPGGMRLPGYVLAEKRRFPDDCLWLRGMLPLKYLPVAPSGDLEVVKTGVFLTSSQVVADGLVVATDASGGMFTKDPRLRRVSWSVVVGRVQDGQFRELGTMSGLTPPGTSVAHGESYAIVQTIKHTLGQANQCADELAGKRAATISPVAGRKVQDLDRLVTRICDYLDVDGCAPGAILPSFQAAASHVSEVGPGKTKGSWPLLARAAPTNGRGEVVALYGDPPAFQEAAPGGSSSSAQPAAKAWPPPPLRLLGVTVGALPPLVWSCAQWTEALPLPPLREGGGQRRLGPAVTFPTSMHGLDPHTYVGPVVVEARVLTRLGWGQSRVGYQLSQALVLKLTDDASLNGPEIDMDLKVSAGLHRFLYHVQEHRCQAREWLQENAANGLRVHSYLLATLATLLHLYACGVDAKDVGISNLSHRPLGTRMVPLPAFIDANNWGPSQGRRLWKQGCFSGGILSQPLGCGRNFFLMRAPGEFVCMKDTHWSAVVIMPRSRSYTVCQFCNDSWIYNHKIKRRPFCRCGQPWPLQQSQYTQDSDLGSYQWSQKRAVFAKPTKPAKTQPSKGFKGVQVLGEHWGSLPEAVQHVLKKNGLAPPEPADDEDPLLKLLMQHKEALPDEIKLELDKRDPEPFEVALATQDAFKTAVGKLRELGHHKLLLQQRIDNAKTAFTALLSQMQNLQAEIKDAEQKVEKVGGDYHEKVLKTEDGTDPMDVEAVLGQLGVQLTQEQATWKAIQAEHASKRRMSAHLIFSGSRLVQFSLLATSWVVRSAASPLKTSGPKFFSRAVFDDADHVVSSLDTLEASPSPRPRKSTISQPRPGQANKKQVQEWKALLHILEAAPVMDMPAKEADLLQWIEDLEQSKDDTLGVIDAVDAVLAGFCKKGSDSKVLLIGQANITTYRSEIRTWLVDRDESFWLLQETHVTESDTRALVNKFQSVGKQAWAGPAAPTQGGSSGGLLTLVPSYRNAVTGPAFLLDGKGFVSVSIRFRGWDLLLFNLYLQSGVGPTGGVNPEILRRLAALLSQTSTSWLVLGDWNCPPEELLRFGYAAMVKGRLAVPTSPTINTGGTLDYALASANLAPAITLTPCWDVPFKPHAAVTVELRLEVVDLPLRQLKGFSLEPTASCPDELHLPEAQACGLWDTSQPLDHEWASFSAGVEEQLFSAAAGRGWKLEDAFLPLVKTSSPEKIWKGSGPAFWQSFLLWTSKALGINPDVRVKSLFIQARTRMNDHWIDVPPHTLHALQCLLDADDLQSHTQALDIIGLQGRAALKEAIKQSEEAYSQWLEAACKGGMRGNGDNPLVEWHALQHAAVAQARTLPPITGSMVEKAIQKMAHKAIGADGWSVQMLQKLAPVQLERLAAFFNTWERQGCFPAQLSLVLVALINKSEDEERPIGLTPVPYRLWAKLRWPVFKAWLDNYAATQDWDRAKKGLSSLDVALRRKMSHEILYRKKRHGVTVLLDLKAFYENVSHHSFVAQALALEVPPLILNAAISLYSAPRWISAEKCISGPIKPTKGLVAGCPFAPGLSKIPFDSILRPAWNTGLAKTIDLYVDDTSFDTEAASPELAARRAAQLYKAVVGGLEQAGLPISIGKTDAAKDLGIDCTAGRRMHWLRASFAHELGRMSLGSVDLTIDHAAPKRPDPAYTIISQHFQAIHRLLCFIPDRQKQHFDDILPDMWMEYLHTEYPWKRAAGPVGALLCYLVDLGWTPVSASAWKCPEDTCQITTKVGMHHLLCSLALETDRWRHTRIAQQDSLSPLLTGIDWHPLKKLRCRLPPQQKTSLMAVWQGAIRADPCATCLKCGCAASLNHVLWECSWWLTNLPEPPAFERFRKEWPISSLWSRGMTPATTYPDDGQWVRTTGAWNESHVISGEGVYFATDGSPGRSKDVRFHRYTWAAIAFRLDNAEQAVIATAIGTLQTPLSVFRAEAAAVKFVAEHTQGDVDLTMDCKGILSRRANELVDRLVGEAAEQRRDPLYESSIKKLDAVITQVNTLLAKRSAALLSYDKDQGPQVQWPDKIAFKVCRRSTNPLPLRRRRAEPQDEQAPEPVPQQLQPPEPLVDNQAQGMRNPGVVLRENPQLEQRNPEHRPAALVANQAEMDEVPGIVLRENPYAPEAGPVLGAPNQDSCSEESEEEPMVPDPIVHPEPPPAPPAAHMLPAPLNFDDMDQEAGAAFAIAERARNTKPELVAFKSDLGYAGVFQALPKDQIHVWFNDTGDNTAAYIHNGRTRYGYDVGGGYVLKVGTKQAFGDEVAISALLPKVAATIIGAGSTTLQVLLSGRPWEFRSHLVAWSIVEKVELLTDFGSRNQIHPQWSLYAFALLLQLSRHFALRDVSKSNLGIKPGLSAATPMLCFFDLADWHFEGLNAGCWFPKYSLRSFIEALRCVCDVTPLEPYLRRQAVVPCLNDIIAVLPAALKANLEIQLVLMNGRVSDWAHLAALTNQ